MEQKELVGQERAKRSRQTEDIVELLIPGADRRVRGKLVWRNGPAVFTPEGLLPIELHEVQLGGASSEPKRSWRRVRFLPGQAFVDADIIQAGDDHSRWFSPLFGDGWLVFEASVPGKGIGIRFETLDDVLKVRFHLLSICVGRPAYATKMDRSHTRMPAIDDPDEMNWSTLKAEDGSVFTFRRHGPPPPPGTFIEVKDGDYRLLTPKARKAYDAAKEAHKKAQAIAQGAPSDEQLTLPMGKDR
jgi:hypothetical protein